MGKKAVWMGCLAAALLCFIVIAKKTDAMKFNGLSVMPEEKLVRLTQGLHKVEAPLNMDALIKLDGHPLPYDRRRNTFYASQTAEDKEYGGGFGAAGSGCAVYLQEDDLLEDKYSAVAGGHVFTLWFLTEENYATAGLVFTGLPVISVTSQEEHLTQEYTRGSITVQNPEDRDVIAMSIKESAMEAKINDNSGTISFRLYKKNYEKERELSLLGLGSRRSWKLYPVYGEDGSAAREMLSVYIWNSVCENDNLQKGMEYAEVIVNQEYQGLYLLAPKTGRGYYDLGGRDRLYVCEELSGDGIRQYETVGDEDTADNRKVPQQYESLWTGDVWDFAQIDRENIINYNMYLQAACAVENSTQEYYLLAYEEGGAYRFRKAPGRSKFVFGLYPARIGWQSVSAAQNIIEDKEGQVLAEHSETYEREAAERWTGLRRGVLSTQRLLQRADLCRQRLTDAGYIAREMDGDAYAAACDELCSLIAERMDYLDGYYGGR